MFLKPKSSVLNPPALLYKRFTALEESRSLKNVYKTTDDKVWTFDYQELTFNLYEGEIVGNVINISSTTVLTFGKYYFYYTDKWNKVETLDVEGLTLLSAKYNDVGKYKVNKYYFAGSFDYMELGDMSQSESQFLKGAMTHTKSMNIRTFDDSIQLEPDDLIVIGDTLYSIESISVSRKRLPREFKIYFATLNNIL